MSLAAPVVDGKIVQNTTAANTTGAGKETKANNSMDKDSFLQLLVAQMKYQDPMEPQSNTEYVAQYAQFSELEAMQNLSSNMDLQRATGLVGKEVVVKTTGASGEPVYTQGKVDFVSTEGSKAYMTINGQKYSIDDLDSVMDGEYLNATTLATEFITSLNKLPRAASLTLEYKDVIQNLKDVYNDMTSYQRGYIGEENISKYKEYVERMDQILAAAKKAEEKKAEEKKDQDGSDADSIKAGTTDGDGDSQ